MPLRMSQSLYIISTVPHTNVQLAPLSHNNMFDEWFCRDIVAVTVGHTHNSRLLHTSAAFILFSVLLLFVCFTVTQYVVVGVFMAVGLGCLAAYIINSLSGRGLDLRIDTCKPNAAVASWNNRAARRHACKTFTARLTSEGAHAVMNAILAHPECPILQKKTA